MTGKTKKQVSLKAIVMLVLAAGRISNAQVLWERPFDNSGSRYVLSYRLGSASDDNVRSAMDSLTSGQADDNIIRAEIITDPLNDQKKVLKITYIKKDLIQEKKQKAWMEYAWQELSIGPQLKSTTPPKGFSFLGGNPSLGSSGYLFFDEQVDVGILRDEWRGPMREIIEVYIYEVKVAEINTHEFLRAIVKDECELKRTSGSLLVKSKDRWAKSTEAGSGIRFSWLSGNHGAIYITGLGISPETLVPLYVRKFPSTFHRKFKIDKTLWGREEMELWLGRMQRALEGDDKGAGQQQFVFHLSTLRSYVYLPFLNPKPMCDSSLEDKKRVYEQIVRWWEENREDSYWHKRHQVLVAKDQSPEELRAAAEKARKEAIEARLDAPITEVEMQHILEKLLDLFEKSLKDSIASSLKSFPDCGASYERHKDGSFVVKTITGIGGPLYTLQFQPPEIQTRRNKLYPLTAIFDVPKIVPDEPKADALRYERPFYYHKLEDIWVHGYTPK